ncbi:MAG TPA: DEAD/DEAH box helicase [Thermoanaerobaculia bacterium]|nr:DEAD/DEAH box helicase [Thermoanaerobaculia bacterium]
MLVLHAALDGDSLLFWTEPHDDVDAALQRAELDIPGERVQINAKLPTTPSTPLVGKMKRGPKQALRTREFLPVLARAAGERVLAPGVLVGADLAWCAMAMRYAAALVARGHVAPAVEGDRAVWIPVLIGDEAERFASLVAGIPPAALAFRKTDPRALLSALVDTMLRDAAPPRSGGPSLHDRWLAALTTRDGRIDADETELARLRASVDAWLRPVLAQAQAPFRLAFRLEEPPEEDGPWHLAYLMQGREDRSLLLPPDKAPRELLLRSLGEAASISKSVESGLQRGNVEGLDTDAAGAFAFLTRDAAALESAGFGVFLPSWWSRKGTKKRLALKGTARPPKFAGKGGLTFESIVEVDWRVAVGGEELTEKELKQLAKLKTPLVKVRGQWVQLSAEEIGEALQFLRKKETTSVRDLIRTRLTGSTGTLPVAEIEGTGAVRDLLERLEGKREWEELPEPEGFAGSLRPYQKRGYSWLRFLERAGLGACLADDMGLGKTVQTLALLQDDWPEHQRPVLLICPTSVTGNWLREAQRFTPSLPVLLHHGSSRARGAKLVDTINASALVISTYSLLHRELETLNKVPWRGVVLDEAQNIKNSETRQAKAARAIQADFRIALTGTPVENNVGDLWSVMEFLNPGLLGSASEFRSSFFLPIQTFRDPDATATLKRITGPFILRRLKSDRSIIADLPAKNEMKVFCNLTKEQATLYRAVVDEAQDDVAGAEGIERRGLILAMLSRLKQVCNHPAHFLGDNSELPGRSGKLARLTEMLDEAVAAGDFALVFTQYAAMGTLLQRHIAESMGLESLFLHGGTPRKRRDEMVERFQNDPASPRIFILSLKAGGTGLNLTRASHVFHFDRWWNPAVENQATDRAFRIGQTKSVQVHKMVVAGTLEERIDAMIEGKQNLARNIVGTGEGWLTELSNAQLRDLLTLSREAIADA